MAEEDDNKPEELSLSEQLLAEEEQDVLFKAQMAVANFFLGYWKHMLGVLGVSLLGVLIYGFWTDYSRAQQQDVHQKIAEFEGALGAELRQAHEMGFPMPPDGDGESALLLATGEELQGLADTSGGVGSTYARLRAAALMKAAGRLDLALPVLEQAVADEPEGILGWSAKSQLAAGKLQQGDAEGALAIYQEVSSSGEDAVAQEALFLMGRTYRDLGRNQEAITAWQSYIATYPADSRNAELNMLIAELQVSG